MMADRFEDAEVNIWRREIILGRRERALQFLAEAKPLLKAAFLEVMEDPLEGPYLAVLELNRKLQNVEVYLKEQWAKAGREER